MKIAIDLDGTAFEWPQQFQRLIAILQLGGAEVVFLTAAAGELPPTARPAEVERRIATRLPHVTHVRTVCCESCDKGRWLRVNGFDLLFDDNFVEGWSGLHLMPGARRQGA